MVVHLLVAQLGMVVLITAQALTMEAQQLLVLMVNHNNPLLPLPMPQEVWDLERVQLVLLQLAHTEWAGT
jgi:hypothetical protein